MRNGVFDKKIYSGFNYMFLEFYFLHQRVIFIFLCIVCYSIKTLAEMIVIENHSHIKSRKNL